jgi:hypothetical protein
MPSSHAQSGLLGTQPSWLRMGALADATKQAAACEKLCHVPHHMCAGLAYLSVYAASSILSAWGVSEPTLARTSAAAVLGLGAFMVGAPALLPFGSPSIHQQCMRHLDVLLAGALQAWLRVVAGYHTWPQVIVGFSLGSTMSVVWQQWGWQHVLPQAVHQPWIAQAVVALMTLGVGAFAIKTLLGASKDAQRLRLLMQ